MTPPAGNPARTTALAVVILLLAVPAALAVVQWAARPGSDYGGASFHERCCSWLVPSVSTSYWKLSAVTAQTIVVMYGLMFAAVIRLRHTEPDTPRPYRIPGGLPGV